MNQSLLTPARVFAAIAVVAGFALVIYVLATSLGEIDGDSESSGAGNVTRQTNGSGKPRKAYIVQSGDTLIAIARRTGVSVRRIEALNPGIDPQILVSGQRLKLR